MVFCEAKIDNESYQSVIYIVAVVGKPMFFLYRQLSFAFYSMLNQLHLVGL